MIFIIPYIYYCRVGGPPKVLMPSRICRLIAEANASTVASTFQVRVGFDARGSGFRVWG